LVFNAARGAHHARRGHFGRAQSQVSATTPPVPDTVATKSTELRGAGYMGTAGKLVLVDLDNQLVIGELDN
jgi:hypothetical protein